MRTLGDTLYAVALTLWIGALWTVGYVVAPTLFSTLSDRALAGTKRIDDEHEEAELREADAA